MIQCPNGQTTAIGVAAQAITECTIACPTGSGVDVTDGSCRPCPLGTYSPDAQTDCTACPDGLTTATTGATAATACINCPAGKAVSSKVPGIAGCKACGVGRYSTADMADVDVCDGVCPVGQTTTGAGADSAAKCTVACDAGMSVREDTGRCDNCAIGKYEVNNVCKTCSRCKATAAEATLDAADCNLDAPMCAPGQGPDFLTYKCAACPIGKYSTGGVGSLICGGAPTAAPTVETVTKISVKHTYSLQVGATKFNSASFVPSFSKAVSTVLKVPDDAIVKFTKTALLLSGRRYLLAIYSSQISYDVVAYNVNPKTLTAALANPATSGLIGSVASQLTGIAGTVGTITFVDASPSAGPSTLPTPFSFFAQTGTVSNGIDTMLLIAVVIGFGVGCPVLACIYYQSTLLIRLCRREKPKEQKLDPEGAVDELESVDDGTGYDEFVSRYSSVPTSGRDVQRAVAVDAVPVSVQEPLTEGSTVWGVAVPQVPFFSFWAPSTPVQPAAHLTAYDTRSIDAEEFGAATDAVNIRAARGIRAPKKSSLPPEAGTPTQARPMGDIGSVVDPDDVSITGWELASHDSGSSGSASVSVFSKFGRSKPHHATETHDM
jgi:hypothetical protein